MTTVDKVERSMHDLEQSLCFFQADVEAMCEKSNNRSMLLKNMTDTMKALKIQINHDLKEMERENLNKECGCDQ